MYNITFTLLAIVSAQVRNVKYIHPVSNHHDDPSPQTALSSYTIETLSLLNTDSPFPLPTAGQDFCV